MLDINPRVNISPAEAGISEFMSSAMNQVLGTVELLEQILLSFPLDLLLQARRVSRLWRELIMRSQRYKRIQSEPYIGVFLDLPTECSMADDNVLELVGTLTLYFDRPLTIRHTPSWLDHGCQLVYKVESGKREPCNFPRPTYFGGFRKRTFQFNHHNFDRWITVYPGKAQHMRWPFRPTSPTLSWSNPYRGDLGDAEVGKTYKLRVRPGFPIAHYPGVKKDLVARKSRGETMKDLKFEKGLYLVGENEVSFTVIP